MSIDQKLVINLARANFKVDLDQILDAHCKNNSICLVCLTNKTIKGGNFCRHCKSLVKEIALENEQLVDQEDA